MQRDKDEKTIRARYAEGVAAVCKDDFATFKKIIDPESGNNAAAGLS